MLIVRSFVAAVMLVASTVAAQAQFISGGSGSSAAVVSQPGFQQSFLTWTAGTIATGACATNTFTLLGAATAGPVIPVYPVLPAGITPGGMWVSAVDTISVAICNFSGGNVTVGALTYSAMVPGAAQISPNGIATPGIPTIGLAIQYDMLTVSGGALTDLSGNGNNGTLHGTTQTSAGTAFNGSSDYVAIPPVVKNSDFTAIIVSTGDTMAGALWYEGDTGQASTMRRLRGSANIASSGGNSGTFASVQNNWGAEYHTYYVQRASESAIAGLVDRPYRGSATVTGTPNFSADACGSIGAQSFGSACSTQNSFFTGTVAYFLLYTRSLTAGELASIQAAIQTTLVSRGVYNEDAVTPLVGGPIWNRMGTVIAVGQEPSVLYDTNCQIVASPCFKMWFSRVAALAYAESLDGLGWTIRGPDILSKKRSSVLKVGTTYYLYVEQINSSSAQTGFDAYTSTDGINWTLLQAGVLVRGSAGTYDATTVNNPHVIKIGATWYMAYESQGNGSGTPKCNIATSSDGVAWTKSPANPITGFASTPNIGRTCQGPFIYQAPTGRWYLWGGAYSANTQDGIARYESGTVDTLWAQSVSNVAFGNGSMGNENRADDPFMVEVNGRTYMYYGATGVSNTGTIKAAVANMPISQIVQTAEGATSNLP